MWKRKTLKKQAKNTLKHNYWRILGVMLIVAFIGGGLTFQVNLSPVSGQTANGQHFAGKSNSEIVNELLNYAREDSLLYEIGQSYHPTKGVLSGLFNNITASNSFLFGFLNALNQMIFGDRIGAGAIIFVGAVCMFFLWLLVGNVLEVGRCRFFLETRSYYKTGIGRLLMPFSVKKMWPVAGAMFLRWLYLLLWDLTIIGGIIKSYSYKMVPYILAENPGIGHRKAFRLSRQMMKGEKWRAFVLDFSYIGWYILNVFTFGLLNRLFLEPYQEAVYGELYLVLRQKAKRQGLDYAEELWDPYLGAVPSDTAYPKEQYPLYRRKQGGFQLELGYRRHYSVWSLILLFFTFSIIGWLWEVGLYLVQEGEFVNRGTMFGPWLPIYGTGGVLVVVLLKRFVDKPWLTYLLTVLICGTVEYVSAWYLWENRHVKYWDYSGFFGNIQGRVCLEGLIIFGIGGCAFIYILAPLFDELFKQIPKKAVICLCCILLFLFACDFVYSSFYPNMGEGITAGAAKELPFAQMADYGSKT